MPRIKKLTDYTYSPTNPASEDAIRTQIDDAIQEVYDAAAKPSETVNLTGDQTVNGIKTFNSSPIVPTPTTNFQASTKKYVDDGLLANKTGNHEGTWQGYTPSQVDQTLRDEVNDARTSSVYGGFVDLKARADNSDVLINKKPFVFDNVSKMVLDTTLSIGDFAITKGYHSINDGGSAIYSIVASATGTADGGILIDLTGSSKQAQIMGSKLNTRQLGLVENDQCQDLVNNAIWRNETRHVVISDKLRVYKKGTGVSDIAQILPKSNFTLEFEKGSSLTLFPSPNEDYYRMISIEENRGKEWGVPIVYHKENIKIINPVLIGDRQTTTATAGEFGHGIMIFGGVENIEVVNPKCFDMFGDGYGVSGNASDGFPLNVSFNGLTYAENCRRQGMSVGGCTNLYVENIHAKDIDGTAPYSAIDFEPNANGENVVNAYVGRIYGENVRRALLVTGFADKQITVGDIITDQSTLLEVASGEVELHGNGYNVNVSINKVYSKNAKDKNILYFRNTNKNFNCNIGVVEAENYYKTIGSSVYGSATVLHHFADPAIDFAEAGNINVDKIRLINPTYESTKFDYYLYVTGGAPIPTLFKNIKLPIENPLSINVDSNINIIKLQDSLIVNPNFSKGETQSFGFDTYEITPLSNSRYFCNPFNSLKINNPKNVSFFLGYKWFRDYVLDKVYTNITNLTANELLLIDNFNGYIELDHTLKTISFKKLTFDATY